MTFTTHIFVGAAIGSLMPNPWLAFLAGLVTHHLLDLIPHIDEGTYIDKKGFRQKKFGPVAIVALETIIASAMLAYVIWQSQPDQWLKLTAGALGGTLADLAHNVPFWSGYLKKKPVFKQWFWLHDKMHGRLYRSQWLIGVVSQGAIIVLALLVLVYQ